MGLKQIAGLIPLVQNDLVNNRYELHELIVKRILSKKGLNTIFDISGLNQEIVRDFNFKNFPNELLIDILEKFVKAKYLKSDEHGKYETITKFKYKSISADITECYKEFIEYLKKEFKDFDLYIYKNFEPAFRTCLCEIVNVFLEQEDFYKNQIEALNQNIIEKDLIDIADSEGVESPKEFVSLFYKYLNSGKEKITNFIFFTYRGAITYDLLRRGSILSKETCDIGKGGLLLLDTNTLISLICETDRTHRLASSTVELSKKLKFDVCYTKKTKSEYNRLLGAADSDMKVTSFFKHRYIADNQLIKDFIKRKKGSWGDYHTLISNVELYLKSKYDIDIIEIDKVNPNEEVMDYVVGVYPTVLKLQGKERFKEALDHDLDLLALATHLRKSKSNQAFDCPWILSFDTALIFVNELTVQRFNLPYGFVLHPRYWLNTLLVFSNVEFDEGNKKDIVRAIMYHMIFPEKNILSLEQYAKLVTEKIGLTEDDIEFIMHIFTISPLKRSLEISLESNDAESATKITSEILIDSDLIDKAISERKTKVENIRLKETLKTVSETIRIEKTKNYLLEEVVKKPIFIQNISIENTDPKISKMIEVFINRLEQLDPDFFEKTEIQKLTGHDVPKETTISTLKKIKNAVHQSKEFTQDFKDLIKLIPTLIGLLTKAS